MSSRESDLADRRQRERQLDANLSEARRGTSRLRDMADRPAPDREQDSTHSPNTSRGGRP